MRYNPLAVWLKRVSFVGLSLMAATSFANDTKKAAVSIEPFPKPEAGFERHVIHLPIGSHENSLKIELLPGKVEESDCNIKQYNGKLEEKILEGWGYSYYILNDLTSTPTSTLMACSDDSRSLQFIPVHSPGSLLQYNSQLPVVVYLPKGLELRWRTWLATPYNTAPIE